MVKKIIVKKLDVDSARVKFNSNLRTDFGADWLDVIEVIMECEKEFHVFIPDKEAATLSTVQNLVDYLSVRVR